MRQSQYQIIVCQGCAILHTYYMDDLLETLEEMQRLGELYSSKGLENISILLIPTNKKYERQRN